MPITKTKSEVFDSSPRSRLQAELDRRGWRTPERLRRRPGGGRPFSRSHLYRILSNAIYIGQIVHKGVAHAGQHQAIVDTDLWEAVQQRLADNLRGHGNRSDAAEPSLLAGLVFDALRIPAPELERAVMDSLVAFLHAESRLMAAMGDVDAAIARSWMQAAAALAAALESEAARRIEVLKRVLARVTVKSECIEVAVHTAMIWASQGQRCADDPTTSLIVPVRLKRCGLAVRLIVEGQMEAKDLGPGAASVLLLGSA